jgi:tRNA threonylcarbamoyladenosine biosynthesis protein TsaE
VEEHYVTHSPEETIKLGEVLGGELLHPGAVIAVDGDLGAGKTHLVKGMAGSLGLDEISITSPTYALANEYDCTRNGVPFTLFHLDCYRFEKPEELLELGVEDYLYPAFGATIVEWPERIATLLPPDRIEIHIRTVSDTTREISITRLSASAS